jgi:putative RNA 2'-phosphotransferase
MSVDLKALSKQLSWILRHEAERLDLAIDPEGYVRLDAVLDVIRRDHPRVTEADIRAVVEEVEQRKQRFSIAGEWIRANYGHSLAMRIAQEAAVPPDKLFHGTTVAALEAILREGLRPMQRQYVHLTPDAELARSVGSRHGKPCLVQVDARHAHAAGVVFYRANRSFWLAEQIPAAFLSS